ncbi:Tn3 family transposase [Paraburkholderia sp. HD33-4]|uniref:Tn3 family transposase n=1 Tax=Paraburkholderia sp. HD33-4 TaxID=2883242 RepID=UPI001F306991|nr:Tn3 family transposase [Paraburkholderia sp. HD33-4]
MTASHRLSILTRAEIDELYALPLFTDEDRHTYFELGNAEQQLVRAPTLSVAVHLILQLGYFKAKFQFFHYDPPAVADDLRYIVARHFPDKEPPAVKIPSAPTRRALQHSILDLFGFRLCEGATKAELEKRAQRVARHSMQPAFILRECLQYLKHERVVAPTYSFLQDMVDRVVGAEHQRVSTLLERALTRSIAQQLDAMLEADESIYQVTLLKREPKDFSHKELQQESERRTFFAPLYAFAQKFLDTTGISADSIRYYASLVTFYTVYKLRRMNPGVARLYLLCFTRHRLRQVNDRLIEAFIRLVNHYEQTARQAAGGAAQNALTEASTHLKAAGEVLRLFVDGSIPYHAPFASVRKKAFALLAPERFEIVSQYLCNVTFDKTSFEWSRYTALSYAIKRNLRHLFAELVVAGRVEDTPLLEAIAFLQECLRSGTPLRQCKPSSFPTAIIPKALKPYLYHPGPDKAKRLDVDRFEFLVYRLARNALEAGDVFCHDSNEFRRFEDDLISDARWRHKSAILNGLGLPVLLAPIEQTLAGLHDDIERLLEHVNHHINEGDDPYIRVRQQGGKPRLSLVYPGPGENVSHAFYGQIPSIDIARLFWFVAGSTGFLKAFTHVLDRYVKHEADPRDLLACIIAMGTNMALRKMAEISGLSYAALVSCARNYLRVETVHAANDAISNATAALPAFHLFNIGDQIHSSSDGQRFETQFDTFQARHSPKYFGLDKGISANTAVANHVPFNLTVFGAHEHESHYVFDLLYNNTSDIRPQLHSTDTHGTNQVNYWILHAFGYQFAPRYRDLHKKLGGLVGRHAPGHYGKWLVKTSRKVNDELIIHKWPVVQRIMASLGQKQASQATIVRKLSRYKRQNQTKKALWELDNLCRTGHILRFINDADLRQSVQRALNRGEAYHRLRRAVAFVNGGKLRVHTDGEQQLWNECARPIANAIIHYNTALLSRVHEQKRAAGDKDAMAFLAGMSPVAWRHVNLFGAMDFGAASAPVDIDALGSY